MKLQPKLYEQFIKDEIKKWIDIQEEIGLDVLVHGEFERTDMVEYFGEKFNGFALHIWLGTIVWFTLCKASTYFW